MAQTSDPHSNTTNKVLVTRAEPGAFETQNRLLAAGYAPVLSPVLELTEKPDIRLPDPDTLSGLIFTSANGVRFFSRQNKVCRLPVWCVGPATAAAARQIGFEKVYQSSGNATQLADFILKSKQRDTRPLAHIANSAAAGKLAARLRQADQAVLFFPLYEARPVAALSAPARELLAGQTAAIILIHSAKAASHYARLAAQYCHKMHMAIAISEPAAAPLEPLGFRSIISADHPDEDNLFKTLKKATQPL